MHSPGEYVEQEDCDEVRPRAENLAYDGTDGLDWAGGVALVLTVCFLRHLHEKRVMARAAGDGHAARAVQSETGCPQNDHGFGCDPHAEVDRESVALVSSDRSCPGALNHRGVCAGPGKHETRILGSSLHKPLRLWISHDRHMTTEERAGLDMMMDLSPNGDITKKIQSTAAAATT